MRGRACIDAGSTALWWVAGPGDYGRFVFAGPCESAIELFVALTGLCGDDCRGERIHDAVGLPLVRARLASPRELAVLGARDVRLSPEEQFVMMGGRLYKPRRLPAPPPESVSPPVLDAPWKFTP